MKITISLTNTELSNLVVTQLGLNVRAEDVEIKIEPRDVFSQADHAMFAEVRQLRSSNQIIAAIKCFRAHTGLGLALSKCACENLDEYIKVCRTYGGFVKSFMGYAG